jgi:hypothetical protein
MSKHLYHFTTSAHLPRIVRSGELRPAIYRGEPRDFVHATDNENSDRTAAGWGEWNRDYRAGNLRRVRFTLDADDFEPWRIVVSRYPDLTTNWIAKLEQTARNWGQSTSGWYCCPDPLPLTKVVATHTRAYSGHRWEAFDWSTAKVLEVKNPNPNMDCLGVKLDDKIYMSARKVSPNGYHEYKIAIPMRQASWNPTQLVWSD